MKVCIDDRLPVKRLSGRLLGFALLLGLFALGQQESAFAQAGSTGGAIGKTNKSQSGETPSIREVPKLHKQASSPRNIDGSSCGKMPGVWSWFNGGDVIVKSDGTMTHNSESGTWSCKNDKIVMFWKEGWTDRLTLLRDGTHLKGTNGFVTVTGDRR
jgi:hypothetical protein